MPEALHVAAVFEGAGGRALALAPDGATWASCDGLAVEVRDAQGALIGRAASPGRLLFGLAFDPAGDVLVAAPRVLELARMDWRDTGDPVAAAVAGLDPAAAAGFAIHDAAVSGDASRLVVRAEYRPPRDAPPGPTEDGPTVRLAALDARTLERSAVLWEGQGATFTALAATRGLAAAAWVDVDVWRVDGTPVARFPGTGPAVRSLALSADGTLLAAGQADGAVLLGRPGDGREAQRVRVCRGHVPAVAIAPGGRAVLAGGEDGTLAVLSADGAVRASIDLGAPAEALAVAADGDRAWVSVGGAAPAVWVIALP